MKKFSKSIFGVVLVNSISLAFAANWITVGEGSYVDLDSKKSKGELASIMFRGSISTGNFSWVGGNYSTEVEFDCKRNVMTNLGDAKVLTGTPEAEALKRACTSWYKFWK